MDVEYGLWRTDRYMGLAMCQEIDDWLVFPKARVSFGGMREKGLEVEM